MIEGFRANLLFMLCHRNYSEQEILNEDYDRYRFHTNLQNEEIK